MASIEKCDIVYCWVWGEHSEVQRMFREAGIAMAPQRSYSHDFIKRSIELLRRNMSWHTGRIVLVSACGLDPPDLDLDALGVTVIDQEAILPPEHRPALNNMVVESALHRIPGLTDTFIYMNDDQFLLRETPMDIFVDERKRMTFFRNEYTTIESLRRRHLPGSNTWSSMCTYNAELARKAWGIPLNRMHLMQHLPCIMDKAIMKDVAEHFAVEIDRMGRRHTLRHPQDVILLFLCQEWCRAHCPERVRWICHHHRSSYPYRCEKLSLKNQANIVQLIRQRGISMLTLSETERPHQFVLKTVQRQLEHLTTSTETDDEPPQRTRWQKFMCCSSK